MMGILTDDMKNAIPAIRLCFVATVSPDGKPNLSAKGSLCVWDDDHLLFADIAFRQFARYPYRAEVGSWNVLTSRVALE